MQTSLDGVDWAYQILPGVFAPISAELCRYAHLELSLIRSENSMKGSVHIFWDNSNIFIPAKYVANKNEGTWAENQVRVHFQSLYDLAKVGREVESAVCVGSVPPELQTVWSNLRQVGVEVELYERGSDSGTEQGVDQCLQVHMLRVLADSEEPSTAVLLTGDGAGYETGIGFHADLERMADRGWGIEVISWDTACNNNLKEWAKENGAYIPLEDYYRSVTFLEGTRNVESLTMTKRPIASPEPKST